MVIKALAALNVMKKENMLVERVFVNLNFTSQLGQRFLLRSGNNGMVSVCIMRKIK